MNFAPLAVAGRPRTLPWLTVLRYPAAASVVIFHASMLCANAHNGTSPISNFWVNSFIDRGFIGVSFFFMLSGFILAWNYPEILSVKTYLGARAGRILPIYYFSLLVALPLYWQELRVFKPVGRISKTVMILTLSQSWIPKMSVYWNSPAWTLSCEAFFYISLIWILPHATKHFAGKGYKRLVIALLVIWAVGLIAPYFFTMRYGGFATVGAWMNHKNSPSEGVVKLFIERFPLLRVLEFIAGVILCKGMKSRLDAPDLRTACLLIIFGVIQISTSVLLPFIYSVGTWCLPGFACVIAGGAMLPAPGGNRLLALGVLLGNASYAVYLLHGPVEIYMSSILACYAAHCGNLEWFLILAAASLLLVTLASIVLFNKFEEPSRKAIKGFFLFSTVSDRP